MEYRPLGNTGISVSLVSLGTGGHSRIGKATCQPPEQSVSIVKRALEAGVNLIDSAELYGTEELVGQGITGHSRPGLVLSTKAGFQSSGTMRTGKQLEASLEASLRNLRTDYVDIYHLHGVVGKDYAYCREELVPVMQKLRRQGKIRYIGITERFASDPGHKMLQMAVLDDCWDVFMVGFNILNQSGRSRVIRQAAEKGIGILDMFAVRRGLIGPAQLLEYLEILAGKGQVDPARFDMSRPLADLMARAGAESLTELAYRFCISESGISSILCGTGNPHHLEQNLRDFEKGPLAGTVREELVSLFERVDSVSGE